MPLTRDDVVEGGLRVLEESGFPGLTMRRLAAALGVAPGALYWHVENKQALLALLAGRILDGRTPPAGVEPWPEALRGWAHELRRALCRYRDGAEVVASVLARRDPAIDPAAEAASLLLEGTDLEPGRARVAALTLLRFALGHCIDEQGHEFMREFGVARAADEADPGDVYDAGVSLLLAGIARS